MQILFRKSFDFENELQIAQQYHTVYESRSLCHDDTVIGRYSVLPYYQELEKDLLYKKAKLINSYTQHRWIANFEYYNVGVLKAFTFPTWTDDDFHTCKEPGPFVVKGRTNSRKHQWNTHMFAADRASAARIGAELCNDPLLGEQGILYRKYIPLETFEEGINGLPFTNEWRFFFFKQNLLTYGYYWSQAENANKQIIPVDGVKFAQFIAKTVKNYVNFFVLDVAKTQTGAWILVEINDGQMSGLGMCDPHELYRNLKLWTT